MVEASEAYGGEEISVVVKKEFALHYECNGGSLDGETKTSYSNMEEVLLPEPDREDFLFLGWSETKEDKGDYIVSYEAGTQGDKTLYAMWEPDTDAEDTSLLNEEEEQLLQQKDSAKKAENKKILNRKIAAVRRKPSQTTEKNKEQAVYSKDTKDSLTEASSDEAGGTKVVDTGEETQTNQTNEGQQTEQEVEMQTESKAEPQKRNTSPLIILLFIAGLLCTAGSLGGMLYFQKK